jgi:hypothetical protein
MRGFSEGELPVARPMTLESGGDCLEWPIARIIG